MKITTNNQYRPILHWNDLNESEQKEYKHAYDDVEESNFCRYSDWCYDLKEHVETEESFEA